MSYPDPYTDIPKRYRSPSQSRAYPFAEQAYDYPNPYSQPHRTYDHGGYDVPGAVGDYTYNEQDAFPQQEQDPSHVRQPSQNALLTRGRGTLGSRGSRNLANSRGKEVFPSVYDQPRGRSASALKAFRFDHQGNLWTKGGRGRCVGRFCCCTIMIVILLILGIALSLALWIRPPAVTIGDVQTVAQQGSAIQLQEDGVTINLGVNITVNNPNYFTVNLKTIKAEIIYPINDTDVGGGTQNNIVFNSNSFTNFQFPFQIIYKKSSDPEGKILLDLAQKCGTLGGAKSNITVKYKITLGLRILIITISPVISNEFTFLCPLDPKDLEGLMGSVGSIGGLLGNAT